MGKKRQSNRPAILRNPTLSSPTSPHSPSAISETTPDPEGQEALTAAALAATNELIATAKELYMSLGGDSSDVDVADDSAEEEVKALLGADAPYWSALPKSVRQFVGRVYKLKGGEAAGLARSVREAAAALVPSATLVDEPLASADQFFSASPAMAPPPPPPPSSVSIGKKPMAYQQAPVPPATAPRSARAAAKAPASYQEAPPKGKGQPAKPAAESNNKIWSTSSIEERERIRDFWLGLAEEERRDLVRVEKDTVLRKMKEEQKHSCSCAVCGRKRTAIEDELQVLYDAYYEDLEQYALYQQQYLSSNRTIPPPPGPGPFPGSVEVDRYGAVVAGAVGYPPAPARRKKKGRRRARREPDDEPDVYEEEIEEPDESDQEEEPPPPPPAVPVAPPAVNGRGRPQLAARGGRTAVGRGAVDMKGKIAASVSTGVGGPTSILTVADDLLKNDGRKFLEMMEQLAERRLAREEEAAGGVSGDEDDSASSNSIDGDDGVSSDGEEGESENEDDDGESEGESADDDGDSSHSASGSEEEDETVLTEEQKMEEGKRMFSIFAARMFEQRVLQAYRERVAQERQAQLLRELADEDELKREREVKKQSQAQKKKDKKRQQKLAKEEKEASKAAERAVEEAEHKAKQAAMEEEQRKKKDEEKAKREAARKLQDEERRKKLAEEAERERKRKEKEEKIKAEKREKDEKEKKAREEREAKERERKKAEEKAKAAEASAAKARSAAAAAAASLTTTPTRSPHVNGQSKKILHKPVTQSPAAPPPSVTPVVVAPVPPRQIARPIHAHSMSMSSSLPPVPTPVYAQQQVVPPPISPRGGYAPPPFGGFAAGPSTIQPRVFPDAVAASSFHRPPISTPAPIGPPRRPSLIGGEPVPISPGPIGRPAPIARPAPVSASTQDSGSGSGSASPARRSPSPKGILGSSALLADDDEVVAVPVRRPVGAGVVGSGAGAAGWGAPGSGSVVGPPGRAPPGSGFGLAPAFTGPPIGAGRAVGPGAGLWGNNAVNNPPPPEWHPTGFYPRAGYLGNSATSPGSPQQQQ
ncbi:Stress response protein NST1 [Mycena indigotica]|uniref:Stress response protein NST1 n=1 Tax=Mycena indigotica TaxID=2126181 RepID=A0A8H6SEV3_9AGAR|nr:Stress response protein NST1 [Mycena indigotica]KAF7297431.1 Stress response protein NST1 [Mycena indigotica]